MSVVVPVRDDESGIRDTLSALLTQHEVPGGYEIIVVDNDSRDATPQGARAITQDSGVPTLVLGCSTPGSYAARNVGIRAARGELLCFLDADESVDAGFLSAIAARMGQGDIDYLGMRVQVQVSRENLATLFEEMYGFRVDRYLTESHFAPTCALVVRRAVIEAIGDFDGRLESGGDVEFGQRVHAAGYRQAYAPDLVVDHPARGSQRALLTKARRVARGVAQLNALYPGRFSSLYRGYFRLRRYLPVNPLWIRSELAARGRQVGLMPAIGVSLLHSWLAVAGLAALLRECRRLHRQTVFS